MVMVSQVQEGSIVAEGSPRKVKCLSNGLTGSGGVYSCRRLPKEGEVLELCRESVHLANSC